MNGEWLMFKVGVARLFSSHAPDLAGCFISGLPQAQIESEYRNYQITETD